MADPKPLKRSKLSEVLGGQRAIRAFEELFKLIPMDIITLNKSIREVGLSSSLANNKANQVAELLEEINQKLELILQNPNIFVGTIAEQDEDQIDFTGGVIDSVDITNGSVTSHLKNNQTILGASTQTLTDQAAANVATLTNAPTAGNPTKWVDYDDNGTTRRIPLW